MRERETVGDAASRAPAPVRRPASVQFLCPRCEETFLFPILGKAAAGVSCPHCRLDLGNAVHAVKPAERPTGRPELSASAPVAACWVCGNEEFYVQKDFNRQLGFLVVAVTGMLIFLVMLVIGHLVGVACLFVLALADWMIYRRLADVTVCYLCQSVYRGFPANPRHAGFYLGCEEKYKKLRQSWLRETLKEAS